MQLVSDYDNFQGSIRTTIIVLNLILILCSFLIVIIIIIRANKQQNQIIKRNFISNYITPIFATIGVIICGYGLTYHKEAK